MHAGTFHDVCQVRRKIDANELKMSIHHSRYILWSGLHGLCNLLMANKFMFQDITEVNCRITVNPSNQFCIGSSSIKAQKNYVEFQPY